MTHQEIAPLKPPPELDLGGACMIALVVAFIVMIVAIGKRSLGRSSGAISEE